MTANHEHTPTTGQVETGFAFYLYDRENIVISAGRDRFKAWLAARDARIRAAAEQREAIKALRDAADALKTDVEWVFNTNRGIIIKEDEADPGISPWAWLRDRADQMEGDDETH